MGDEYRNNTHTAYGKTTPEVAPLTNGGFVATWTSYGQVQFGEWGIYGQLYDATGNPVGTEFRVSDSSSSSQKHPTIASLEDGGFVVAWQSNNQDGSGLGIFGQRYDSSGSAIGNEFRVNSYTNGDQKQASVSGLADGGFVVIWISDGQDGSGFGVFGQRYDANSSPVGSEFAVNTTVEGNQGYHDGEYLFGPALTSLATGGFVVSWTSQGQDG